MHACRLAIVLEVLGFEMKISASENKLTEENGIQ